MNQHLVSIIVPVYGVERYISECVDSILAQTHQNLEVILVDDGSPDSCGAICDKYAAGDSRVKVIHQINAGAANAKNAGLDAIHGDYIAFVDSDDWVDPDWVEKMLRAAADQDADVVECNFRLEYVGSASFGNDPETFVLTRFETQDYLRHYLKQWSCALFWNKLFQARLLKNVRFHTERRCVDDEFFTYKAVTGANRVLQIPDALYHYRQRCSSVMQTETTLFQRTVDSIDILAERYQWIKTHYPNIAMDYLRHDVDTLLYFAVTYPFNRQSICCFRKTAKFYFAECICRYPGKITLYCAARALLYRRKNFRAGPPAGMPEADMVRLYP